MLSQARNNLSGWRGQGGRGLHVGPREARKHRGMNQRYRTQRHSLLLVIYPSSRAAPVHSRPRLSLRHLVKESEPPTGIS